MNGTLRDQLDDLLGAVEPAPVPLDQIRRRALGIRLRRTGAAASVLAAAGVIALLLAGSPVPVSAPSPAGGRTIQAGQPFASGVVAGKPWRLAVQDIADPGYRCVPAVTVNGGDADPIGPYRATATAVTEPAFVTLGAALPGTGIGFMQVAPGNAAVSVLADGNRTVLPVTTVAACGERFRLAGFAYPLTAPLRISVGSASATVSGQLSDPLNHGDPQPAGVWLNMAASYGQVATGTLAAGQAYGQHWSIRVQFGAAGDCYALNSGSSGTSMCGPVSTPSGRATIEALPLGFGGGGGVGYAGLVSPDTARVVATLFDGSTTSAVPRMVDGRRYAAFFVPGSPQMAQVARLSWLNAAGATIASATWLTPYGVAQFQP